MNRQRLRYLRMAALSGTPVLVVGAIVPSVTAIAVGCVIYFMGIIMPTRGE